MSRGRSSRARPAVLATVFALYAVIAVLLFVAARRFPATPQTHWLEVLSEAVIAVLAIVWSVLLFREMDSVWEHLLLFLGIGLVFVGAWEDVLDEFYELSFSFELLENAGLPLGLVMITGGITIRMISHRAYANRMRTERDAVEDLAMKDPLTGLHNRRYLRRELEELLARSDEHGQSICLAFMDADNFKQVNDHHGHDTGDAFLVALSRAITSAIRDADIGVRFGGDEFVVVLVGAELDYAVHVAERIQALVHRIARPYGPARADAVPSISIGLAAHSPGESGLQLIARADEAMYAAKRSGKDRLAVA